MQLAVSLFLLFIIGLFGSVLTKQISENKLGIYWAIVPSIFSSVIWGRLSRLGYNLNYVSMLFDVIYTVSYICGFVLLGEPLSLKQFIGIIVSLVGVYLMSG